MTQAHPASLSICAGYNGLAVALAGMYLRVRVRDSVPMRIRLDLDNTADAVHGAQEGSGYHGYFRRHMYHPLVIYDGDASRPRPTPTLA